MSRVPDCVAHHMHEIAAVWSNGKKFWPWWWRPFP